MVDQASGLRELVRDVRHEAQRRENMVRERVVSTGPPRVAIVAATPHVPAKNLAALLREQAAACGAVVGGWDSPASDADWLVDDLGVGYAPQSTESWQQASVVVLTTTPDPESVLAAYATLKAAHAAAPLPPVELVVWEPADASQADLVYESLRSTCELFLPIDFAGCTSLSPTGSSRCVAGLVERLMAQLPSSIHPSQPVNPLVTHEA